jgi:hypothetical protein
MHSTRRGLPGWAMPRKQPTAHAQLDRLRQAVALEGQKAREIEVEKEAARIEVQTLRDALPEAYASDDARTIEQAKRAEAQATEKVADLEHRHAGAQLRAERAKREVDLYIRDNSRRLLEERSEDARRLALDLQHAAKETVRLHKAFTAMRSEIDRLVAATPGAQPRLDGPPSTYAWESAVEGLARAIREQSEIAPPLPRWHGLHREQTDAIHRRLAEQRARRAVA